MASKRDKPVKEVEAESWNAEEDRLAALRQLYPECFTDGTLDVERLLQVVKPDSETESGKGERYGLGFAGRAAAMRAVQWPSSSTLDPDRSASIDFDTSRNVMIEGDNLEALRLLQKPYHQSIKVIYLDPPYNTGHDFIYNDDFRQPLASYLEQTGQVGKDGTLLSANSESSGRFHSDWLRMMFPRLVLARNLLTHDGVVFVSIDEHEVHNLRLLLDEVFGPDNFVAQITIVTNPKGRVLQSQFAQTHDYLLVYARDASQIELSVEKSEEQIAAEYPYKDEKGRYRWLELRNTHRQFGRFNRRNLYYPFFVNPADGSVRLSRDAEHTVEVYPDWDDGFEGCWTWGSDKSEQMRDNLVGREITGRWKIFRKGYVSTKKLQTVWNEREFHTEKGQAEVDGLIGKGLFYAPKPSALIRRCIQLATDGEDDLVMDFFAGSGTTAHAVMAQNAADGGTRRFLLVQLPEQTPNNSAARKAGYKTIFDLCRQRVIASAKAAGDSTSFRTFRLRPSHIRPWRSEDADTEEKIIQQAFDLVDPVEAGVEDEALLWEVLLKLGTRLDDHVETLGQDELDLRRSEDGSILVCLNKRLTSEQADQLAKIDCATTVVREIAISSPDDLKVNVATTLDRAGKELRTL